MITDAIYKVLSTDAGVVAILGTPLARGDGSAGIFPAIAPKEVKMPYVVFTQYSIAEVKSYQGVNRFQGAGFQFSCYSMSYLTSKKLAYALKQLLQGLDVQVSAGSPATAYHIEGVWCVSERDLPEPIPHATLYNTQVDFEFNYVDQG